MFRFAILFLAFHLTIGFPGLAQQTPKSNKPEGFFDFSFAGYHLGKELPSRKQDLQKTFRVEDFGAVPNDGKDDIDAIQKAVNAAETAGGGIVLFPRGTFDFDVETSQKFIHVRKSNVVIRGWGDGPDGTILFDHKPSHSPDPNKKWLGGTYPSFFKVGEPVRNLDSLPSIPVQDAKEGAIQIRTARGIPIEKGNYVLVQTNPPDTSLTKDLVFPLKKIGNSHTKNEIKYALMVRVISFENGIVTLDAPITWKLQGKWNPRLVKVPGLIEETGIENFRLVCDWKEEFIHHKDDIHDSGWDQIHFYGVENGWVRNVVSISPSSAIVLSWCKNCVVYDCQIQGNRGHNGYQLGGGSTRNLWMNLKGGAAMHTYSMNGYCSGNVFLMCFTSAPTSVDCHGSLCIHNLFDNMYGPVVQNGGNGSALPPAHAYGLVLYNFHSGTENAYNGRITTNLLKTTNYPGIRIFGLRSIAGFDVSVEDETGTRRIRDFSTPFGKGEELNYSGKLAIPSLFMWQHKNRYGKQLPSEPGHAIQEDAEE